MTDALLASNLLLWALVLVLSGVVLALMRQIGILHERVAPAGALVGAETPRVGEEAPILEVMDWRERPLRVGGVEAEGASTLLFFLSPTCPVCKSLLPTLRSLVKAEGAGLRLVLVSDGPREEHADFVDRHRLDRDPYVLSTPLVLAYQVGKLPYAVLVDARGIVRARGLVNTREHLESLFEARARGVASIQEYLEKRGGASRVA